MLDGREHGGTITAEGRRSPQARAVYTRVFTAANNYGALAQSGVAEPSAEAFVVARGCLAVEQQAEPVLAREVGSSRIVLHLEKRIGHGAMPRPRRRSARGWVSIVCPFNGSSQGRGCSRGTGWGGPARAA
ncbi:MAG TPA: hypothetical protein VID96_00910, partial [Xanthobacteraceae bacterium]